MFKIAWDEDFDHVLKYSTTKVRQKGICLGLREKLYNNFGLVCKDCEMEARVTFDFCLKVGVGSVFNQIEHNLVVSKDNCNLEGCHAVLISVHKELLLKRFKLHRFILILFPKELSLSQVETSVTLLN